MNCPVSCAGPSAGLPRVYGLVLELISHVDAQMDAEPLRAFIAAYQTVSPLKLGELWAIPIMLRLALIENLRRVTARLMIARHDRDLADLWVQRLQDMARSAPLTSSWWWPTWRSQPSHLQRLRG